MFCEVLIHNVCFQDNYLPIKYVNLSPKFGGKGLLPSSQISKTEIIIKNINLTKKDLRIKSKL